MSRVIKRKLKIGVVHDYSQNQLTASLIGINDLSSPIKRNKAKKQRKAKPKKDNKENDGQNITGLMSLYSPGFLVADTPARHTTKVTATTAKKPATTRPVATSSLKRTQSAPQSKRPEKLLDESDEED